MTDKGGVLQSACVPDNTETGCETREKREVCTRGDYFCTNTKTLDSIQSANVLTEYTQRVLARQRPSKKLCQEGSPLYCVSANDAQKI